MMKWIVNLFLDFLIMYFEGKFLFKLNNHEYGVSMNGSIKNVEKLKLKNEYMHLKCKYVVIVEWNIL